MTIKFLLSLLLCGVFLSKGYSCTRILHVEEQAVMVGRSMDWSGDMQTQLRIYPRGMARTGKAAQGPSLHWKSLYGSMVVASYKNISTEGINEKGLGIHLLELSSSNYGERQLNRPGISASEWGQYCLDNFETVAQAINALKVAPYQVEAFFLPASNALVGLHLAIDDSQGNSAIIEYINGKAEYYIENGNTILTNSPSYNLHLDNLKQYTDFGGHKPLPGTSSSKDRFVRASLYNIHMPLAKTVDQEALALFSILRNVAAPFESSKIDGSFEGGTLWQVVGDLTNRRYYYFSTLGFNTVKIQLDQFNLSEGASPMMLDIDANPELHGNVFPFFKILEEPVS